MRAANTLSTPRAETVAQADMSAALMNAAREYSTAAVMLHAAIAEVLALGITDLKTLDLLQRCGPLTAGEIAERTGLATASVTSLIDRLQNRRWVRRRRDRADRRRVVVNLTPRVASAIAPFFHALNQRMRARSGAYSSKQIELIAQFLRANAQDMRDAAATLWAGLGG